MALRQFETDTTLRSCYNTDLEALGWKWSHLGLAAAIDSAIITGAIYRPAHCPTYTQACCGPAPLKSKSDAAPVACSFWIRSTSTLGPANFYALLDPQGAERQRFFGSLPDYCRRPREQFCSAEFP